MGTTLHKDLTGIDLHVAKLHADTHVAAGTDPLTLAESQVTDLTANLASKVNEGDARLTDARTPIAHVHPESEVTDLVSDLAGKTALVHLHVKADITDFPTFVPGTGDGNVVGPVSSTPGNLATYVDATGKNIGDGGAIPTLSGLGAEAVANKSTDVPTDATSDMKYPSVKAVKDYADGLVAGLLNYRGAYDASVNTYPATGGSGTAGAVMKGDMWAVSVAGTLGGVAIQGGDVIIAKIDTPAQTAGNWNTLNTNISYVPEDQANKENTTLDTSTTKYPTNALVKAAVDGKKTDNVSATDKLLGRSSAGAGPIEEIPCTPFARTVLDDANAAAILATLGAAAYSEGTWTPVMGGFTIVGAAPAAVGLYRRIGNLVYASCIIHAGAGGNTSVAGIGGASFVTGIPTVASIATCQVMQGSVTFLGNGFITPGTGIISCTFTAQTADIYITAVYAA